MEYLIIVKIEVSKTKLGFGQKLTLQQTYSTYMVAKNNVPFKSLYGKCVFYKEEPNLTLQFVRRNTAAYISLHSPFQPKLQNQVMYPSGYLADTTSAIPQELELVLIDSQCLTVIKQFPEIPE